MERVIEQAALSNALRDYISSRPSANTRGNYRNGLNRFARWMGKADREEAMLEFLGMGNSAANQFIRRYRSYLEGGGVKPGLVDFLIAPIRGFTRYAKEKNLITWRVTFAQNGRPRRLLNDVVEEVSDPTRWPADSLEAKAHAVLNKLAVGRKRNTWRSYTNAYKDFAAFLRKKTTDEGLAELLRGGKGAAFSLMLDYQATMERRNMKSASVAARTSALKSFANLAQELEVIPWNLAGVKCPQIQAFKDTRGPQKDRIVEVVSMLAQKDEPRETRDLAIIAMLYCHGLRITEVLGLDLEHLDLAGKRAFVLEKGARDRRWISMTEGTIERVKAWLRYRGPTRGPLFTGLRDGGRLTRESAWKMTVNYGLGRPHGLRHAGITRVLDITHGDVRVAQRFSRHKNINMLLRYDDNRQDLHGEAARQLEQDLTIKEPEERLRLVADRKNGTA